MTDRNGAPSGALFHARIMGLVAGRWRAGYCHGQRSINLGAKMRAFVFPGQGAQAVGMGRELADKFVGMYVNRWTLDCGPDGRRSIQLLLDRAHQAQLIPEPAKIEIVG